MSITLTDNAIKQVKKEMQKNPNAIGIRLHLDKAGCSGYMYKLNIIDKVQDPSDYCFESDINIYVAKKDFPLLEGTKIDFVREGLNYIFKYHNPNESASCGCGESFTVNKEFE